MYMNLLVPTLCLLGTVILCGVQTSTVKRNITTPNASPTTPMSTTTVTTVTTVTTRSPVTTTPVAPTVTSPGSPVTTTPVAPTVTSPGSPVTTTLVASTMTTPNKTTGGSDTEALSPGAIAGITIGSIAGVGAVGGGIFAALKFTGMI